MMGAALESAAARRAGPLLVLRNVGVKIGGVLTIDGIDLTVEAGEIVGVLGPNGSGKSTLLRCMAGLQEPSSGAIMLEGVALSEMPIAQRGRRLAMQSQDAPAAVGFSVRDVVGMGRLNRARSDRRATATCDEAIETILARLDLYPLQHRAIETLSGGERQRVLLARAVAQDCPLLLLDEPTNHLDLKHRFAVLEFVTTLGATVIAALHEPELAARYCSRIVLIKAGRIVADGNPRDVLTAASIATVYGVEADVSHGDDALRVRLRPAREHAP